MNIFYLDPDPQKCAQYHCDKHVIKLILETAQLLEAVHIIAGSVTPYSTGKKGWSNHPCAAWAAKSIENYLWLCNLGQELCKEYNYRYEKIHALQKRIQWYFQNPPKLKNIGFTEPYQAVGEELRNEKLDAVSAYRRYYQTIKKDIVTWEKKRKMPEWMKKNSGEF